MPNLFNTPPPVNSTDKATVECAGRSYWIEETPANNRSFISKEKKSEEDVKELPTLDVSTT